MLIESFSHPKRRDWTQQSEDTVLIMPGVVGIFDGATDPLGRTVDDVSLGRLASETVAAECGRLFANGANFDLPAADLMRLLSDSLGKKTAELDCQEQPATTMVLVLFNGDEFRFVVNGDSGVRINCRQVLRHRKEIDDVAATARIKLFRIQSDRCDNADDVEINTRRAIFLGLSKSLADGQIRQSDVDRVIAAAHADSGASAPKQEIEDFLLGGIQNQHLFTNRDDCALGYSGLNGSAPLMRDVIDQTLPTNELRSIELFSDGYFQLPETPTIQCWEAAHEEVEHMDFHKVGAFANVKGSTSTEFADDRSVVVMKLGGAGAH